MLLSNQPLPAGRRVGVVTNAGGPGILAADACEAQGLELPAFSPKTAAALRAFLPEAASVGNPVDMLASAPPAHYRQAEQILLADDAIDSLLVIFIPPIASNADEVARAIVEGAAGARKPVLSTFMSARGAPKLLAPIPSYPFPESAVIALARAAAYGEWRRRPAGTVSAPPGIEAAAGRGIVARALERGGGWLSPTETEQLLAAFGIAMAPARLARTPAAAAAAAREPGIPGGAQGGRSRDSSQDRGRGRAPRPRGSAEVAREARALKKKLGADLTDFLVQTMVPGGVEVIAGVTRDPTFGPLVLYGSGGTLVELLADVAFRLPPLTDADVDAMLEEVRGTALLRGYRGAAPMDEGALRDLLLRLSTLAEACPEVREMDLNPSRCWRAGFASSTRASASSGGSRFRRRGESPTRREPARGLIAPGPSTRGRPPSRRLGPRRFRRAAASSRSVRASRGSSGPRDGGSPPDSEPHAASPEGAADGRTLRTFEPRPPGPGVSSRRPPELPE